MNIREIYIKIVISSSFIEHKLTLFLILVRTVKINNPIILNMSMEEHNMYNLNNFSAFLSSEDTELRASILSFFQQQNKQTI